jgi:AcrR family transcriptional regulator
VFGLSLRKVAQRAGVSHAAPYAHFADKQALMAAISTEGLARIAKCMDAIQARSTGDPLRELVEIAWAYLRFAIEDPAHFKITFSGAVEKEQDYPALVTMTRKNFAALRQVTERCQAVGILHAGPADLVAVGVWSQVHGLASLMLENQLSHTLLDGQPLQAILVAGLQQLALVPIDPQILDGNNEPIHDLPTADR